VYGKNKMEFTIENTLNRSLGPASPTVFDAGGFDYDQIVLNLSGVRPVEMSAFASPLNVAVGIEARREEYSIFAGEPDSYRNGGVQLNGQPTASGAQVFAGFRPENAGSEDRTAVGAYVDLEANVTDKLLASAAVRAEHYSDFGENVSGFTIDGTAGVDAIPSIAPEHDRRYYAITVNPQVFINLVPDHVIFHRMYPVAADRTIVDCDWLYLPEVVASGKDLSRSIELFHRVNEQDFDAAVRCQLAADSRAYAHGGVLVPSEHHIGLFHEWVSQHLDAHSGHA